ncbi:MAG: UDP-N-acetylmuramoyl-tripeptide--D-alanyl-D-alanine ligase [Bryobacteraceae bacterium]|nr:UDP-N-acetylmuramoyl-tripeptide--D-alanyl-D-alanine ligase [Bryobacteraceae bacterium]
MTVQVAGISVSGWSVDTRTLAPGDLFIALRGPNHDGHDYVAAAFEKGAIAALVEKEMPGRTIVVGDTQRALEDIARRARREWGGVAVGVTGSAGKTSTKDIVADLLAPYLAVSRTVGNLNNHIGVPLSILRIADGAHAAVLEMGMNHAGEIRHLCSIAAPDIGVVTNVGTAHIENFESREGIALAKRELIESLPAHGTAVLNADDARVAQFAKTHPGRTVLYGFGEHADVRATDVELTEAGSRFAVESTRFETALVGRHAVSNVLAGIAVARLFGVTLAQLAAPIRALAPGKMRGQRLRHAGALIIDDCYNSNPDAARAMLDVLRDSPAARRIAVLGEMLELGSWTEPLHRDVGDYAAAQGINLLVGIRGAARHLVDAAVKAGMPDRAVSFFEDPSEAGDYVRDLLRPGDAALFKGSRGVHVERALERVLAAEARA